MIASKKYIHDLRANLFIDISEDMEKCILKRFGNEPEPDEDGRVYEYTEQDLVEQIRTMIKNQSFTM